MKTFVIGDIHGRIEALKEVLSLSKFDYENDKLIVLGDVVDGGLNTYDVIEELLKIKNLVYVFGNHDVWFIDHMESGWSKSIWTSQGGEATLMSYERVNVKYPNFPKTHIDFFNKGVYYYKENDKVFVHGGFIPNVPIEHNTRETLVWDRDLIEYCRRQGKVVPYGYKEIYVGHTTTQTYGKVVPVNFGQLWMLDTGAGWNGKLTILDIDTKEYWQSKLQKPVIR